MAAPISAEVAANAWRATPASFAAKLSNGTWQRARHLEFLSDVLAHAAYHPGSRIVVSMPTRFGKSELTSRWYPAWYFDRFPDRRILLVSHTASLAHEYGRGVRNIIQSSFGTHRAVIAPDSYAADRWHTTAGGGMIASGVHGPIMGRGANVFVIDDYFQEADQALLPYQREKLFKWWQGTARPRLEPGASVVIVATRYHEDDLIGRLLRDSVEDWTEINLPAIAIEGEDDPLGRLPGESLWPERWPVEVLKVTREESGPWIWAAVYQGRPKPIGGGLLRPEWLIPYDWARGPFVPAGVKPEREYLQGVARAVVSGQGRLFQTEDASRWLTVDLAVSLKPEADYTAISTWAMTPDHYLLLLNIRRERMPATRHVAEVEERLDAWGCAVAYIESEGYQLATVQAAREEGLPVKELRARNLGSKEARAIKAQAALESGRVLVPRHAPWLPEFLAELESFPEGHDDMVDTLTYAVDLLERARKRRKKARGKTRMGGAGGAKSKVTRKDRRVRRS